MNASDHVPTASAPEMVRFPNWRWIPRWAVLTMAAIPAALLLMVPLAATFMLIFNLGVDTGLITRYDPGLLDSIGFFIGFSLTLATAQWLMLRNYLPNARGWFLATATGLLISGMLTGVVLSILSLVEVALGWEKAVYLLLVGGTLGAAQWLILRRILSNAFWILIIDIAAACSLLLVGRSITSILELLIILLLPGVITGLGIWLLFKSHIKAEYTSQDTPAVTEKRPLPMVWIGLGIIALIPMFFLCSWVYAASQLALAKNDGIYSSVEEGVIMTNSQGWGGAQVLKLEDIRASVNQHDGSQPHVWFGGARVYLDRVPQGWDRTEYSSGSYYLHVKEGWVLVPEGAFPEFIGWVMELYNMEGVHEWTAETR